MDLKAHWRDFQTAAAARGLRIYPGTPRDLNQGAFWQGDPEDFESFLDLAQAVGVRIVYALNQRWDPESFLEDLEDLEDLQKKPASKDLRRQVEALAAEARARAGELSRLIAAWVHEGQVHIYVAETDWAADLQKRKEALLEASESLAEADDDEESALEAIARQLAENPEFQQARNYDARIHIAWRLFPELRKRWRDKRDHRWWELVRDAWGIYGAEILPRQEQEIAKKAASLLASGLSKKEAAARLGISVDRLNRLLQASAVSESG